MKPFAYYKILAKRILAGKALIAGIVTLFSLLLSLFINLYAKQFYTDNEILNTVISAAISIVIVYPFSMGVTVYFMNLARNRNPKVGDVFDGYKYFFKILPYVLFSVVMSLLSNYALDLLEKRTTGAGDIFTDILTVVIMLLPVFIQLYLTFTFYIIYDGDSSGIKAMIKSFKLTKGKLMYLIALNLSFIPWFLLILVTLGCAILYLVPFMELTMIVVYEDLKNKQINKNINENEEKESL